VAPRSSWEGFKKSKPQNELEAADCLGFLEKQDARAPFDRTNAPAGP